MCLKIAEWVANSVDPDGTPHFVASHAGLHCLLWPVLPDTSSKSITYDKRHAQTDRHKIMTKSSVITNQLSITMAGLIIDHLLSPD